LYAENRLLNSFSHLLRRHYQLILQLVSVWEV
jgi:hypothetical protein